jgi:hypothetical protein
VCLVADRGVFSRETVEELEMKKVNYILGARMRRNSEVSEEVLARGGRYREVYPAGARPVIVPRIHVGKRAAHNDAILKISL